MVCLSLYISPQIHRLMGHHFLLGRNILLKIYLWLYILSNLLFSLNHIFNSLQASPIKRGLFQIILIYSWGLLFPSLVLSLILDSTSIFLSKTVYYHRDESTHGSIIIPQVLLIFQGNILLFLDFPVINGLLCRDLKKGFI